MRFQFRRVQDPPTQQVFDEVTVALNETAQFVSWGDGAPSHTPDGPQLYFDRTGIDVYRFNGVWTVL